MTYPTTTEYLVTSCPTHGEKVTTDYPSLLVYIDAAWACERDVITENLGHDHAHEDTDTDCWVCCPAMVIDPHGHTD